MWIDKKRRRAHLFVAPVFQGVDDVIRAAVYFAQRLKRPRAFEGSQLFFCHAKGPAYCGRDAQVRLQSAPEMVVVLIQDGELDVDEEPQLVREAPDAFILRRDGSKQVGDADGSKRRLGLARAGKVVVDVP